MTSRDERRRIDGISEIHLPQRYAAGSFEAVEEMIVGSDDDFTVTIILNKFITLIFFFLFQFNKLPSMTHGVENIGAPVVNCHTN